MIRARFKCTEVAQTEQGSKMRLTPVLESAENAKFFKGAPYWPIEIGAINPEAIKDMIPGKEFYVDFTPVK